MAGIGRVPDRDWDWRGWAKLGANQQVLRSRLPGRRAFLVSSIGPTPIFPSSTVLLSSSLFARKYTDLAPTRLLSGVGDKLDSTVRPLPLALLFTGTGPTPRLSDPTGITLAALRDHLACLSRPVVAAAGCHSHPNAPRAYLHRAVKPLAAPTLTLAPRRA